MESLKQQLHFLSKKSVDKHNNLSYTHENSMYCTKEKKTQQKDRQKSDFS